MILGACSLCGGTVEVPDAWYGIDPPRPTCRRCHATKKLAVIEMDAPRVKGGGATEGGKPSSVERVFEKYCDAIRLDACGDRIIVSERKDFGCKEPLDDAEYLNKVGNG